MKNLLINIFTVAVIAAASAGLALLSLDLLIWMGVFGQCHEDGCDHSAAVVGFPVVTVDLAVVGCALWFAWRGRGR